MPLLDSTLAQVIFAFVMIGLFALVLRWTFSGGASVAQADQERATGAEPVSGIDPVTGASATGTATGPERRKSGPDSGAEIGPGRDAEPGSPARDRSPGGPRSSDDYGLLAPAATVDTAEQAARARELLSRAGIRATTTIGSDGRHRVLVFARDLDRARRVAGSSG